MYFGYSKYFYDYEHLQNSRNIMINILCHLSSERDVVNAKLRTNVHLDGVDTKVSWKWNKVRVEYDPLWPSSL